MDGWLRSGRRAGAGGSPTPGLAGLGSAIAGAPAAPARGNGSRARRQISEADLHGYIDGGLDASSRLDVEAFLAAHPLIAERVEVYRSHSIALTAAFRAGEDSLPPGLARLASRYARAVAASSMAVAALGILGLVAILCVMAGAALGAHR